WWLQQTDDATGYTANTGAVHRIHYGLAPPDTTPRPSLSVAIRPNPFSRVTGIAFRPATAGRASLVIYDLAGRKVRRAFDGDAGAGVTEVEWDGTDDGGRRVSPGLYVVRLAGPGGALTARLLRLP